MAESMIGMRVFTRGKLSRRSRAYKGARPEQKTPSLYGVVGCDIPRFFTVNASSSVARSICFDVGLPPP